MLCSHYLHHSPQLARAGGEVFTAVCLSVCEQNDLARAAYMPRGLYVLLALIVFFV